MPPEPTSKYRARTALLVEGQPDATELLIRLLSQQDFSCLHASTFTEGKQLIRSGKSWNLAFVSLDLPDGDGLELIHHCFRDNPSAAVYTLIDPGDVVGTFRALKAGTKDCIIRYGDSDRLYRQARLAISCHDRSSRSGEKPSTSDFLELGLRSISWKTSTMERALSASIRAAADQQAVLIQGEPGTGKGAFAKLILRQANANPGQIATLDASRLSAEEAEIHLFGSPLRKKAKSSANGFLSENNTGWKILRGTECLSPTVLQALAAKVSQIATTDPKTHCSKFIFCTSQISSKHEDMSSLFANLPCHQILTPPLRDCVADLEPIIDHVLERICIAKRIGIVDMTPSAIRVLKAHSWPGNLAELSSVLEHAATHSQDGIIGREDLPPLEQQLHAFKPRIAMGISTIQNVQKAALVSALESCNGNRRLAAKKMGVSLRTIYNMIKRYELNEAPDDS